MSEAPPQRPGLTRGKRWFMGLQVVIAVASLLAIVIMVNYLSNRHYRRFQWAQHSRHELSPLTREFLHTLTNEVQVTVLFNPEESTLFAEVRGLLEEYAAEAPGLKVEFVDYGRNLGRAEAIRAQYQLGAGTDTLTVMFETEGRLPRVVRESELSDFDISPALQGKPVRRVGFKGEQFFTAALLSLADVRPVQAYMLTGHGEADCEQEEAPGGYFRFRSLLSEKNIQLRPLSLRTNGVPADCELLVVAGPRYPVTPEEAAQIEQYLESGGRALVLLYSTAVTGGRRSGLEEVLRAWGVEVLDGLVIDPDQSQAGDTRVLLTGEFGAHRITAPLRGARLGMIMPAPVLPRSQGASGTDAADVKLLVSTSEGGEIVTGDTGKQTVVTNGVISVALAAERGAIAGVDASRGASRVVVVGDAHFLSNQLINYAAANREFGGLVVNWLLDRQALMELGARPVTEYQVNLTRKQLHGAAWLLVGFLPGSVLLVGLLVWVRRRR